MPIDQLIDSVYEEMYKYITSIIYKQHFFNNEVITTLNHFVK